MIRECKRLDLFAAKFQLFGADQVVNKEHLDYCMERCLTFEQAEELFNYGLEINQTIFFTCMHEKYVKWCERIGVEYYKIRFYDNGNKELIWDVVQTKKPFFISVYPYGSGGLIWKNQILLNCIPKYPASFEDYFQWGEMGLVGHGHGASDHTPDMKLFKWFTTSGLYQKLKHYDYYWERHVCLDSKKETCLEREWCSTFKELEEVLE